MSEVLKTPTETVMVKMPTLFPQGFSLLFLLEAYLINVDSYLIPREAMKKPAIKAKEQMKKAPKRSKKGKSAMFCRFFVTPNICVAKPC